MKWVRLLLLVFVSHSGLCRPSSTTIDSMVIEKVTVMELPSPHPLVITNIGKYASYQYDKNYVPLTNLKGKPVYYPISIAQIACTYYAHYLSTESELSKKRFLSMACWLLENFKPISDKAGTWVCNADYPDYYLKSGWSSAMAQGYGLSSMIEAYWLTKDESYLITAEKALNAFYIDIDNGGLRSNTEYGCLFEEYAGDPATHVLNGFLFAQGGLYNYYETTGSKKALSLFKQGTNTLKEMIHKYDAHFTSMYSLHPDGMHLANAKGGGQGDNYHELHIMQLLWLAKKSGCDIFEQYALRFLSYDMGKTPLLGTPKIDSIWADKTIDTEEYGVEHLNNSIWTYGKYWSTRKLPTEIHAILPRKATDIKHIVLVNTAKESAVSKMGVSVSDNGVWQKEVVLGLGDVVYELEYPVDKYRSFVQIFSLPYSLSGSEVKLKFYGSKGDIIALRELDIQYNRSRELEMISKRLNY